MEPKLNFQVPAEGLEMLILQHRQYKTLGPHKSVMHHHSHPNIFFIISISYSKFFFTKMILKNFPFEKIPIFSEKNPLKA